MTLPEKLPVQFRTVHRPFFNTLAPVDRDEDTFMFPVEKTFKLDVVIENLQKANVLTNLYVAKTTSASNKYGGRSNEVFNPFRDVFAGKNVKKRFDVFLRPEGRVVGESEGTIFNACDELLATIWPDTIPVSAKIEALNQLVLIEVKDKYICNLLPRMVLLVCPNPDTYKAGFTILGIKDNGEFFTVPWIEDDDDEKIWRFHSLDERGDTDKTKNQLDVIKSFVWGKAMWMDALDKNFAQVGHHVLEHYYDHDGVLQTTTKEMHNLIKEFSHRRLYNLDGKFENPMKIWSLWSDKKTYKKAVYDPSRPILSEGGDVFNLFTGFGVEPTEPTDTENPCPHIMRHFKEVLSDDNPQHLQFWFDALATWVRNPEKKLGISFVLRGPKGIGKGVLWQIIKKIWGIHSIEIVNQKHLVGNFNSHLDGKSAVNLNEAVWGGSHQANSILLSMITEDEGIGEKKGKDAGNMRNCWVLFIMANADWCFPATKDNRRGFMPTISARYRGNKAYFDALGASLDKEVPEFLYYLLYQHDITPNFHAGNVIQSMGTTEEGVKQMLGSDKMALEQFFKAGFEEGRLNIGGIDFFDANDFCTKGAEIYSQGTKVLKNELVDNFKCELEQNSRLRRCSGLQKTLNTSLLSRRLKCLFGPPGVAWKKDNVKIDMGEKDSRPAFWFAPMEVLRMAFAEHTLGNKNYTWPDAEKTPLDKSEKLKSGIKSLHLFYLRSAFQKFKTIQT